MDHIVETKNQMKLSDRIILYLLCLYFILKPFYFWSSGLPQISDCILVLMFAAFIIKNKFLIRFFGQSRAFLLISLGFVLYVVFINTIWVLITGGRMEFFIKSAFYVYNFASSLMILALYYDYHDVILRYISTSIFISIFIQMAIFLAGGGFDGTRALAFFNNPNQLGYHNVLMLGYLILISKINKLKAWLLISALIATMVLCFSSLSKAAIVAYSVMLIFFLAINVITRSFDKRMLIYLLIIVLVLSTIFYLNREVFISNKLFASVMYRISRIGLDKDDNFAGRGYDRLINYPQYLIFGAGEGEFTRFGYDLEVHSTLGNILMSYGIIGFLLYLSSIVAALKNNRYKDAYIIFPIFLYGLTHNGIRNTLLWIMIALMSTAYVNAETGIHNDSERKVC